MKKELKHPTTFCEQVDRLRSHGVIVNNPDACVSFLERVNYYRFSGYYYPFQTVEGSVCEPPVEFGRLVNIYQFDTELRSLIAGIIEKIEIYARTQIAYNFSHKYGAEGYLLGENFNNRHDHAYFQRLLGRCIKDNENSPVIRHHMDVYNGHFPLWVIIDYFSLGMLSHFYTDMKNPDKAYIARSLYSTNYKALSGWLRCLTDLRNRCAHYSRLYNWNFPAVPHVTSCSRLKADHKLYSQLYVLKRMYPYPEHWDQDFVHPLRKMMRKYGKDIDKGHLGFPRCWLAILRE